MNSAVVMVLFYILWNFIITIQGDVSSRVEGFIEKEKLRKLQCAEDYDLYNCVRPLPKTFADCEVWKACKDLPEPRIGR